MGVVATIARGWQIPKADERAGEAHEREVDVRTSLVPDCQPSKPPDPRKRAFYDRTVPAEALARLDTLTGNAAPDSPVPQVRSATTCVGPL